MKTIKKSALIALAVSAAMGTAHADTTTWDLNVAFSDSIFHFYDGMVETGTFTIDTAAAGVYAHIPVSWDFTVSGGPFSNPHVFPSSLPNSFVFDPGLYRFGVYDPGSGASTHFYFDAPILDPTVLSYSIRYATFNCNDGCFGTATGTGTITQVVPVSVPEPATLALFGLGLMGLGLMRWRREDY